MSTQFSGFVQAGLLLGLAARSTPSQRGIFNIRLPDGSILPDIIPQLVIEENANSDLEITEHPVQTGAAISDHSFKRPNEVTVKLGWSNSPSESSSLLTAGIGSAAALSPAARKVADIVGAAGILSSVFSTSKQDVVKTKCNDLYNLQNGLALFDLYTGKLVYRNMMLKSLVISNDYKTEYSLFATLSCRQLILVNTETVKLSKTTQREPDKTAVQVNKGVQSLG